MFVLVLILAFVLGGFLFYAKNFLPPKLQCLQVWKNSLGVERNREWIWGNVRAPYYFASRAALAGKSGSVAQIPVSGLYMAPFQMESVLGRCLLLWLVLLSQSSPPSHLCFNVTLSMRPIRPTPLWSIAHSHPTPDFPYFTSFHLTTWGLAHSRCSVTINWTKEWRNEFIAHIPNK